MKENTDCTIVADLMTLSLDGLTSEESEQLIQEHIQTCKKCLRYKENLIQERQETEFYSYYRDTFGSPTVQTYLKCTYNEQSYAEEIKRLENTSKIYGDEKKVLLRDDSKKYQYPAYIAVENAAHKYEYALLTGEKEITYIFTDYIEIENVKFSKDYLPNDYMTEEGRFFGSGYSIYYESVSTSGIATDYTR